ncbi:hypothetical protein FOTG_18186 [Fusarium oxysporum f. sp. vasinfectum 25433]|uniref:Uncharacterized protein n=1 Tax=Fusarium oxysporum f. sp. vasinfectum 25433 TaxID=1089449 RepID=X0KIC3_FUSOX|nr:hypothetical protein FOTG_18186 [Fusarium oxysporum f. sp. vasinfectum 25433]
MGHLYVVHVDLQCSGSEPWEEADQATTNADLQRIKTLGTIKVVVGVAKGATQLQEAPSFDDGKKNESLALSQKALVLDNHERGHGTSYRKIDDNRVFDSPPLLTPDTQSLGCFFFFYRPHDFFEAWNMLDPSFIKHEVHGMQQPTQGSRASIVPAGSTVIDLTGGQPMGQS